MKKLFFALLFVFPFAHAMDFSLEKDECIILVASTKSETEARAIANKYPGAQLYASKSGYIAIGLEKISKQESAARIKGLLNAEKIPKGSNCADGTRITGLLNVDGQKPEKQAKKKDTEMSGAGSGNDSQREIGICIGFISKTIDVNGVENVDSRYMKYLKKNNKLVTDVINTTRNYPQCFEAGVIISDCLQAKKVSSKTIGLMKGYNTGLTNYNDSVNKAVMSAACVEL